MKNNRITVILLFCIVLFMFSGCSNDNRQMPEETIKADISADKTEDINTESNNLPETPPEKQDDTDDPITKEEHSVPDIIPEADKEAGENIGKPETHPKKENPAPEVLKPKTGPKENTVNTDSEPRNNSNGQTENQATQTVPEPSDKSEPEQPESKPDNTAKQEEVIPKEEKSVYDVPYDIDGICSELITIGETNMGWKHRTCYSNGEKVTPDNSSWDGPITIDGSIRGERLKNILYEHVTLYTDELMQSIGGEPIRAFTIYVEPLGNGNYIIYLLH